MKKAKKNTSSSAKSRDAAKVLIPLVSGNENNKGFVAKACDGADELVALLVVDTAAMPGGFGFAASEIGHGNALMEEIKAIAKGQGVECTDLVEWGDTVTKIIHLIQLRGINRVLLVKQDNQFFKDLVKEIREQTKAEVETFAILEEEA